MNDSYIPLPDLNPFMLNESDCITNILPIIIVSSKRVKCHHHGRITIFVDPTIRLVPFCIRAWYWSHWSWSLLIFFSLLVIRMTMLGARSSSSSSYSSAALCIDLPCLKYKTRRVRRYAMNSSFNRSHPDDNLLARSSRYDLCAKHLFHIDFSFRTVLLLLSNYTCARIIKWYVAADR